MQDSRDPDPKLDLRGSGSGRAPWYEDLRVIGILLVVIGVLALPLVWFNRRMALQKKVIITVVAVTIAAVFVVLSVWISDLADRRESEVRAARESGLASGLQK